MNVKQRWVRRGHEFIAPFHIHSNGIGQDLEAESELKEEKELSLSLSLSTAIKPKAYCPPKWKYTERNTPL